MATRAATLSLLSIGFLALVAGCATEEDSVSAPVATEQPVSEPVTRSPWTIGTADGESGTSAPSDAPQIAPEPFHAVAAPELTFSGEYTLIPTSAVVTLAWDAPTQNADGSGPLDDLSGYVVWYGPAANDLSSSQDVGNVTQVQLELPNGIYFVAVRAYDTWGNESDLSNLIQVTVGSTS